MEIVELPPLKRRIEWPTAALAFVIYASWLMATYFYRDLPWWGLPAIGGWIIAWQLNLQHETIHGHPTRKRAVNEAIGCWPLSLWLPYSIYRSTHLAHHRDENLTDPLDDPESYYWAEDQMGSAADDRAPPRCGAVHAARSHDPRSGLDDLAFSSRLGS